MGYERGGVGRVEHAGRTEASDRHRGVMLGVV